jgi:signal transduction histidine kinase/ActR/RegA family two-component response regulator
MRTTSLRRRLLLVGAASLLPLAVASGFALLALVDHQKQRAAQSGIEITRALSIAIDGELQRTVAALQALAADPRLATGDLLSHRQLLERAVSGRPDWTEAILHDARGRMLMNTGIPVGAPLPPTVEMASLEQIVRTSKPVIGALRAGVRGTYRFPVRVPVLDRGSLRYVLTAVVDPAAFVELLDRQRLPDDWVASIFDAAGRRVARSRRHEAFLGQEASPSLKDLMQRGAREGAGITYALEGGRVYTAYTRSTVADWTVALGIPPTVVEGAAVRSLVVYGGGILLSIALGIVAAVLVGRRIVGPMSALRAAAAALGRRERLESPATDIHEIREVGDALAAAGAQRDRAEAEREELLARERQAREAAEALAAGARTINTLDLDAALQNIAESACTLLQAHVATVFRLDPDAGGLVLIAGGGPRGTTLSRDTVVPRGTGLVGLAVNSREAVVSANLLDDPRVAYPPDMRARVEAGRHRVGLAVPLMVHGRITGALFIGALPGRVFSAGDMRLASTFADQAASAIANAELFQETQRANRAKDEFLAMLGHELRNPLNAIGSAASLLGLDHGRAEVAERARGVINRQVQHLARLVDDLLDVSRVTSGKVVLVREPTDLAELAASTIANWRAAARFARHRVSLEASPAWVDADPTRLDQVLGNLLANALKYTPGGGAIAVRVRPEGDSALLEVEDTGAGIPPELLGRVFDLFVQGERTLDRSQGGLGIGLTLARALVEMHGGTIEAQSAGAGGGATFTMRLPRISEPAGPGPSATTVSALAAPRRILIIEDNGDALEMLRAQLERDGHEVHTAADGPAGVEAAAAVRPDVALIDVGLPGFDGYEVARRIRAAAWGTSMRLVALSGYGQADDRRRALEAGCDLHVTKPVMPERLAEILAGASCRPATDSSP